MNFIVLIAFEQRMLLFLFQLYPSHNGGELSNWVSSLSSLERGVENHFGPKTGRGSAELHDVLTAFEIQLRRDMNSLKR